MTAYVGVSGVLLDERDDAIRILVEPNWDVWIPRSTINPNGGLRIKRATNEVSADVASWKVQQLIKAQELPQDVSGVASTAIADVMRKYREGGGLDLPDDLEATDERFKRRS